MENNSNSVNTDAIIKELQKISEGLDNVNTSQEELEEYIVLRDQKADEEKQKAEEEQKKADEEQAKADEEQAKADEEQTKADEAQTQTQSETLQQINESVQLNNQIGTVNILIFGIICGLLFIKIFIDRLVK